MKRQIKVKAPLPAARSHMPLLRRVRACTLCAEHLPLGPRPVLQVDPRATILIAGQAPGSKVHASGERLRDWMGIDAATFYDATQIALLPMGFCYPGTGKSGDLPPRAECAASWRTPLMAVLVNVRLTLVIGQYAQAWHLGDRQKPTLTETVRAWRDYWPANLTLPHPSPRNYIWLRRNDWFGDEVLPRLRRRVRELVR